MSIARGAAMLFWEKTWWLWIVILPIILFLWGVVVLAIWHTEQLIKDKKPMLDTICGPVYWKFHTWDNATLKEWGLRYGYGEDFMNMVKDCTNYFPAAK
jgi:hypothetical protein